MALYHLHVKNIGRRHGRSAVAAAAYRAGETLENEAEERQSAFAGRRGVLLAELHLPEGAPDWMGDRAKLWNAVEAMEVRKDARLAKEVEFSLPRELARDAWFEAARAMAGYYTAQGFVVDMAVHDDGTGHNPHVHLMLATRTVTAFGFGAKLRAADKKTFLKDTRTAWQSIANAALAKAGIATRIDASSYAARGIDRTPGQHHAPDPDARRRRREEVAAMVRDSDVTRIAQEIAADPTAAARYPNLSQRQDWPPQVRNAPGILSSPVRQEERAYWQEVHDRANGAQERQPSEPVREAPAARPEVSRSADRPTLDEEAQSVFQKLQSAIFSDGEERRAARAEAARLYQETAQRLYGRMAQAGIFTPEGARLWEHIEAHFRPSDFDERLAEARRIEAKRREPGQMPEATPAQRRQVEQIEREQREAEGVEFKPAARPPDPFALLAQRGEAAAAAYAAARAQQPQDRTLPPDPYALLRPAPAPEPGDNPATVERERRRTQEWER